MFWFIIKENYNTSQLLCSHAVLYAKSQSHTFTDPLTTHPTSVSMVVGPDTKSKYFLYIQYNFSKITVKNYDVKCYMLYNLSS